MFAQSESSSNKKTSIRSLLMQHSKFSGHFLLDTPRLHPLRDEDRDESHLNLQTKIIAIDINTVTIAGQARQFLLIKDISDIIDRERIIMQAEFSLKLTASLCHEVMNPLNCIISVSEILLMQSSMPKPKSLTVEERQKSNKQSTLFQTLCCSA